MTSEAEEALSSIDMGTSALPGRAVLEIATVRSLSKRSDLQGLIRFGVHLALILLTTWLVWLAEPHWYLMIPAMILSGFTMVTMFAAMHECVHRTAFASPWLNEVFGWLAGLISVYNFHFYRHYHTWHHRYTQDPDRDPELSDPKPTNVSQYVLEISGFYFWLFRPLTFTRLATGMTSGFPYVPQNARVKIAISASCQLAVYLAGLIAIAMGYLQPLYLYFLPVVLAQPLLRAITIAEHTCCSVDENGLTNTRTTLTMPFIRLLMWNMPFHTEHHLYPSIPFFQLPRAHVELREKLVHLSPSYIAANKTIIQTLAAGNGKS